MPLCVSSPCISFRQGLVRTKIRQRRATIAGATALGRDPAVCSAQKWHHAGNLCERNQGPGPPDARREEDDRVGAAIAFPLRGEDAVIFLASRSEEHTSELQSQSNLVCRLLLEKKKSSNI